MDRCIYCTDRHVFLCMNGAFSLSGSDLLLLAGALFFAIQILVIDHFVSQVDAVRLSCIEFFVTGLGTCIVMILLIWDHLPAV